MRTERKKRFLLLGLVPFVILLGLASRHFGNILPDLVARYAGDVLWAMVVFLGVSIVVPEARLTNRLSAAIIFAFAIEVSQLYQADWINRLRHTRLGGLVLGYGFLWSDLVCYLLGISIGGGLEILVERFQKLRTESV